MEKAKNIINKKNVIVTVVIILVLVSGTMAFKHFTDGTNSVKFETLSEKGIPQKIKDILPRYKNLERALACKVDGEIFVVVTRGEKPTGGYTVNIDKIEKVKEEDKYKLVVYAEYSDPKPGEVVTQAVTYPYTIVKTNLNELPYRIELKTKYND